jgi:hypothetical protein
LNEDLFRKGLILYPTSNLGIQIELSMENNNNTIFPDKGKKDGNKIEKAHVQQHIQPKLSTIFKDIVVNSSNDIHQIFGSSVSSDGRGYCAFSALLKYLGYDVKTSSRASDIQYDNKSGGIEDYNNTNFDSIPPYILEIIEGFAMGTDIAKYPLECYSFCPKPPYYFYSMLSLLIHLNDYHKMSFIEIANWLESKDM